MPRPRPDKSSLPADYLEPLVAALADPAVLAGIRVEELEPVTFQLALYFGVRRDPATAAALGGVYERLVAEVAADDRAVLVQDLAAAVVSGASSVLALLPAHEDATARIFEADDGEPGGWTHEGFARAIGWALGKR
ncbi:MAG: hypothetical protein ABL977_11580, partial [Candidatus Eisenbacteria bacterium]